MSKKRVRKNGPSVNKYAQLVPRRSKWYDPLDKTYRELLIPGEPGQIIEAGFKSLYHGRLYVLLEDTTVPRLSLKPDEQHYAVGKFKLLRHVD